MGINLGGIDLGAIGGLLGNQGDGKLDLTSLLGGQGDGKLDLSALTRTLQSNPQVVQTLAKAIGNAKTTPDDQTLQTLRNALTAVTEQAPAEKVEPDLKNLVSEGSKNLGGFWRILQPYLGNADKLTNLLPLLSQYAPKALEALKGLLVK